MDSKTTMFIHSYTSNISLNNWVLKNHKIFIFLHTKKTTVNCVFWKTCVWPRSNRSSKRPIETIDWMLPLKRRLAPLICFCLLALAVSPLPRGKSNYLSVKGPPGMLCSTEGDGGGPPWPTLESKTRVLFIMNQTGKKTNWNREGQLFFPLYIFFKRFATVCANEYKPVYLKGLIGSWKFTVE
jgi:hypothetical protein